MINFNLPNSQNPMHECHSHQEGDWMIFICSQCNYMRQINYKTGKMTVKRGEKNVIHHGVQTPMDLEKLQPSKVSMN